METKIEMPKTKAGIITLAIMFAALILVAVVKNIG
jgi:hypothetical protein